MDHIKDKSHCTGSPTHTENIVKFSHKYTDSTDSFNQDDDQQPVKNTPPMRKSGVAHNSEDLSRKDAPEVAPDIDRRSMSHSVQISAKPGGITKGFSMSSSLTSQYPFAREISETFSTKLSEMRWCGIALVFNGICMYYVLQMSSGIAFPLAPEVVTSIGCVLVELVLLISNIITFRALDDGASAWFGSCLTFPKGFSLSVCGFFQASSFSKWSFAAQLSLNSTCRSLFSRISVIWIILEMMKWLTPISATAMSGSSLHMDSGKVECIVYSQSGAPFDRQWPTVSTEAGFAELIFGSSLGILRSETSANQTTFVMSPQIIGVVNDGDTIIGSGFLTNIQTSCNCISNNITGVMSAGLSNTTAAELLAAHGTLGFDLGIASNIDLSKNLTKITIKTMLSGTLICGGRNATYVPICTTVLSNHMKGTVIMSYMTDGTTASIAPNKVGIRSIDGVADIQTWLSAATTTILGGITTAIPLPSTIPGVLNPLLWWASPNLMTVDPALIEGGIETMFSILLRAAIQRTYSAHGDVCGRNIAVEARSIITMSAYGVNVAFCILSFQLAVSVLATLAFIPWLRSSRPIGAGVRAVKEPVYFTTLLNSSSVCQGFDQLCNAQIHAIWQHLDVVVKIGEPIGSHSESIGRISMDRPKLITWMTNGKRYF
ncbi:hypothetical protein BASA81_018591 [Batrachochytrium salamandrivorans]|nr:hypothetical protein BASA81_018591 [Batrachochytrium salamandrivorans]